MKIYFRTEGGVGFFPGLAAPVEIDTDVLPSEDSQELEAALVEARFFERPVAVAGAAVSRARDNRSYEITVERSAQRRTLRITDPVPADLQRLLRRLRDLSRLPGPRPAR